MADGPPKVKAPSVTAIDQNGVDLISGQISSPSPSLSIGIEGSGLTNSFAGFSAPYASSWLGTLGEDNWGAMTASAGDASEAFKLPDGNGIARSTTGGASTLFQEGAYTVYMTADGTRYYYDHNLQEMLESAVIDPLWNYGQPPEPEYGNGAMMLAKVVRPDGEVITIGHEPYESEATYTVQPEGYGNGDPGGCMYYVSSGGGWHWMPCPPCDENGSPDYTVLDLSDGSDGWPPAHIVNQHYVSGCDGEWGGGTFKLKNRQYRLSAVTSSLGWMLKFSGENLNTFGVLGVNAATDYCSPSAIIHCNIPGPSLSPPQFGNLTNLGNGILRSTNTLTDPGSNVSTHVVDFTVGVYDTMAPKVTDYRRRVIFPTRREIITPRGAAAEVLYDATGCGAENAGGPNLSDADEKKRISSYTRDGSVWTYTYSCAVVGGAWNITSTVTHSSGTAAAGTRTVVARRGDWNWQIISDTDELGRTTSYEYDVQGNVSKVVRPGGHTTTGGYTQYTYSPAGDLTEVREVPVGGASNTATHLVTTATYDACDALTATESNFKHCHKPRTVTDPNGVTVSYAYAWQHGGVLTETMPAVNGVQAQTRYAYQQFTPQMKDSAGTLVNQPQVWRLVSIKKCMTLTLADCANGLDEQVTEVGYSGPNVLPTTKTIKRGDGSLAQAVTTGYNQFGDVTSIDGPQSGTADTTYFIYDAMRRRLGEIGPDPDGGGSRLRLAKRMTYGADGQVEREETGYVSGTDATVLAGMTVVTKSETAYSASTGLPVSSKVYDGSAVVAVGQKSYDAALRVDCAATRMNPSAWSTLPSSACTAQTAGTNGPDRIVKTTYDVSGAVLKTTSAYGVTGVQRDDRVNVYSATDGTLTSAADGEGNVTLYEYDAHLRPRKTRFPNASGGGTSTADYEDLTYTGSRVTNLRRRDNTSITTAYDAVGRVSAKGGAVSETFAYNNFGAVTSHSRAGQTSTFTFNSLGWLLSETSALGSVAYSYDAVGRRSSLTWPDSFAVTYDYDVTNKLVAIKQAGSSVASFAYDSVGRRTGITRPNGVGTSYIHDGLSRLTGLTQDLAGSGPDLVATFAYNPASQLKSRTASITLYEPTPPMAATLSYGVNGLNQVTTSGSLSLTYSARGNTTSDGVNTYTYDAENRLTGLVGGASLDYDAQGRLHEITDGVTTTRMLYDGVNLIAEYDGSGNVLRHYVHGAGTDEPLVWYDGGTANANRRWLIANQQTDRRRPVIEGPPVPSAGSSPGPC